MNYHYEGLEYTREHKDLLNLESYDCLDGRSLITDESFDIIWTNCKDRGISLGYHHNEENSVEKLVFDVSEWLSSFVPTAIGSLSGVWGALFEWDMKKSKVNIRTCFDHPYEEKNLLYIEQFSFALPVTEEQYFQRSLVDNIPFTFYQINAIMNFMELFMIHKDDDILAKE